MNVSHTLKFQGIDCLEKHFKPALKSHNCQNMGGTEDKSEGTKQVITKHAQQNCLTFCQ